LKEEELIYCPNCGLQQRLEGVACIKCGVNLFTFKATFARVCPECGAERQTNYCVKCGCILSSKSFYQTAKIKKILARSGKRLGIGGAVILSSALIFFLLKSPATSPNSSIGKSLGIEEDKASDMAGETSFSPKETYQEKSTPPASAESIEEDIAENDPGKQQASAWLNKFIPMLKSKGLITRIDETGTYTLFVSREWDKLNNDNKNKIIENTAFARKYFGNNRQVIVKDNSSGEILAESGEDGIILYQ
jgi:hypothetical protein